VKIVISGRFPVEIDLDRICEISDISISDLVGVGGV